MQVCFALAVTPLESGWLPKKKKKSHICVTVTVAMREDEKCIRFFVDPSKEVYLHHGLCHTFSPSGLTPQV